VVCFRLLDCLSEDLRGRVNVCVAAPGMKYQGHPLFKGVTSTNIVGDFQLLPAHRGLRASFSPLHDSPDRAVLDGLIRAGFEIRKNHRTEVCGSPFGVRRLRLGVRSLEFEVRSLGVLNSEFCLPGCGTEALLFLKNSWLALVKRRA
jgi:hypothetical protein